MLMQDKYVAYWEAVTKSLSQNPFVIGFDPFNEPMPSWNGLMDLVNTVFPGHFD
jgi:aryl-phospho-beta-D-glucosidase BglC (GH1 family)